jgi:spore photoproduct lyase
MDKILFVHKDCLTSPLAQRLKTSNPTHKIVPITTNTQVMKSDYNLISINPKDRFKQKKRYLGLLKREAKWNIDCNGRSTDFLPSLMMEQGCYKFGCSYCYTERNYPNNFLKIYNDLFKVVDLAQAIDNNQEAMEKKFIAENKKRFERSRDPKHNPYITIDLGCDSDVVTSNSVTLADDYHGHIVDAMNQIAESTKDIMTSFATKSAEIDPFIAGCKNPGKHRIRLSLSPEHHRQVLEQNTSKTIDRLHAVNKLVDAGFEVHINLSPIVVTENFVQEYKDLLTLVDTTLSDKAKSQMAYEIIFLTHSEKMFEPISQSVPKAHDMMVNGPLKLEPKWNKPTVLSYSRGDKNQLKMIMNNLIKEITPYSRIRYMF